MRAKCLAQQQNTVSPTRTRTWTVRSRDERTNHETTASSRVRGCVQRFIHSRVQSIYLATLIKFEISWLIIPSYTSKGKALRTRLSINLRAKQLLNYSTLLFKFAFTVAYSSLKVLTHPHMCINRLQIHLVEYGSVWVTSPRKGITVGRTVLTWRTLSGLPVCHANGMITTTAWEWLLIKRPGTTLAVEKNFLLFAKRNLYFHDLN